MSNAKGSQNLVLESKELLWILQFSVKLKLAQQHLVAFSDSAKNWQRESHRYAGLYKKTL